MEEKNRLIKDIGTEIDLIEAQLTHLKNVEDDRFGREFLGILEHTRGQLQKEFEMYLRHIDFQKK